MQMLPCEKWHENTMSRWRKYEKRSNLQCSLQCAILTQPYRKDGTRYHTMAIRSRRKTSLRTLRSSAYHHKLNLWSQRGKTDFSSPHSFALNTYPCGKVGTGYNEVIIKGEGLEDESRQLECQRNRSVQKKGFSALFSKHES